MKKKNPMLKSLAFAGVLFLLLALILISGMRILEATLLPPHVEEAAPPKLTIVRDGREYFPRQDITTVMVLGIDRTGPVADSGSYIRSVRGRCFRSVKNRALRKMCISL